MLNSPVKLLFIFWKKEIEPLLVLIPSMKIFTTISEAKKLLSSATELRLFKSIFKLLPFSTKISFSLIEELILPPKLSGVPKLYLYFGKYTGEIF